MDDYVGFWQKTKSCDNKFQKELLMYIPSALTAIASKAPFKSAGLLDSKAGLKWFIKADMYFSGGKLMAKQSKVCAAQRLGELLSSSSSSSSSSS